MYDEENVTYRIGINWKDIAIKIVMLAVFLFLLIWLFPKADLDVLYDKVYNDNITTMKEAARSYYTVDRLPKTVGESKSMTLKEMIDNKMLIRFTDKNGDYCDESTSKVEVTKTSNNTYVLKVQLSCGKDSDYILETIGCTSVCENGNCTVVTTKDTEDNKENNKENNTDNNKTDVIASDDDDFDPNADYDKDGNIIAKTITYYQHRQAVYSTNTKYTCPEGYVKNGTKCTKTTTGATIDAIPHYEPDKVITTDALISDGTEKIVYADPIKTVVDINYTCPEGYTLNGSYCIKYTDATEHIGETTYTCPEGYTLSGTTCTKQYNATYVPGAISYSCPNGGSLSGTDCILTTSPSASTEYTCPSGYTKNGTSCYKVYDASSNTTYSCPSGYTMSGSGANTKCTKTVTSSYNATKKTTYNCPNGGTLSGTRCIKTSSSSYNATAKTTYGSWVNQGTKYYTSASKAYTGDTSKLVYVGAISGAVCGSPCGNSGIWYKYTYYTRSKNTSYTCPNGGTLSGTKCTKSVDASYNATPNTTYTCPNGGTLSGTKCNVKSTQNATPNKNTTYSCPNGGTLNGTKCTITTNATPNTIYTCPTGYKLVGSTCKKTYKATPSEGPGAYTCPNGGTLNGSICTLTTNATPHTGETTYTCPEGLVLEGTKCKATIDAEKENIYKYTCPEGYTQSGSGENTKCSKVIRTEGTYYCEDAEATLVGNKCVKTVKGEISYYTCPEDYTLNGTTCSKSTVVTIDATVSTVTTTSYKYMWSTKQYVEGWEFTGKTKTERSTYTAFQK
ncbi:MAG: hypothetical protein ACI4WW_08850 [Candidatus Coprovivens sp.]